MNTSLPQRRTWALLLGCVLGCLLAVAMPVSAQPVEDVSEWGPEQATSVPPPPTTQPPTAVPSPPPTPPVGIVVCDHIRKRVPDAVIQAALAAPGRVYGYNKPLDFSKQPHHLYNPPRLKLSMHTIAKPYHYLWNSLEFKVGCP